MKNANFFIITFTLLSAFHLSYAQCDGGDTIGVSEPIVIEAEETPMAPNTDLFYKTATGEQRIVYWVHGMGGSAVSWTPVGPITEIQASGFGLSDYPARKIKSYFPGYLESSMNTAIQDLHTFIANKNSTSPGSYDLKTDNFVIAHSQGGLVSRGVDRAEDIDPYWQREFGGIVTFGSAHQGAYLANTALNNTGVNLIEQMTTDACVNLSAGPIAENLDLNSSFANALVQWFNIDDSIRQLTVSTCGFFGKDVLPFNLSKFTPPIINEYKIGASYLNTINNFSNQWPKIAFYGEEQEPVFWRTMNTLTVGASNFPAFGADDDSTHLDYKSLRANYVNKYQTYWSQYSSWKYLVRLCNENFALLFVKPFFCLNASSEVGVAKAKLDGYKKGLDWIDNANAQWKAIIGAQETTVNTGEYTCNCDYIDAGYSTSFIVSDLSDCPQGSSNTTEGRRLCYANPITTVISKKNDGIVLTESAKNLPGGTTFGDDRLKLERTNHFQLRNSSQTKEKLKGLLDGDYGLYFKTLDR